MSKRSADKMSEEEWVETHDFMLHLGWHHPNANDLKPTQSPQVELDKSIEYQVINYD